MVISIADGKLEKIEIKAKLNQSNTFNPIKFRMNYGSIMQVNANLRMSKASFQNRFYINFHRIVRRLEKNREIRNR